MERNPLEWLHWGKFLSIWEFSVKKNAGPRDQILTVGGGELKTANEFDCFSSDKSALQLWRTPYFSNVSKIREILYLSEGVCVLPKGLQELAQRSIQCRIRGISCSIEQSTSVDIGRTRRGGPIFLGNRVWDAQSRKITIAKAMAQVSLNHRVTMELLPKPVLPGHHAPPLLRNVRQKLKNRTKYRQNPCLKQLKKS